MAVDIKPEAYGEALWLIFYDLQSENGEALTEDEADWLRSERVGIYYDLRWRYHCVPLNMSVWLIRGEDTHIQLEKARIGWLEEYQKHKFSANISIFPVKTNEEGYQSFKKMEFDFIVQWLGIIEKALIRASNREAKIKRKNLQAHQKKLQLLSKILHEDFDDTYPEWKLAMDSLAMVDDLLQRVQHGEANIIM